MDTRRTTQPNSASSNMWTVGPEHRSLALGYAVQIACAARGDYGLGNPEVVVGLARGLEGYLSSEDAR